MATRRRSSQKQSYGHNHMLRIFALEVLGSIAFLTLLIASAGVAFPSSLWGSASWYYSVFILAVLGSVVLFVMSFANLIEVKAKTAMWSMLLSMLTFFALVILTYGSSRYSVIALAGFALSFLGAEFAHHYGTGAKTSRNTRDEATAGGLQIMGSIVFIIVVLAAVSGSYPSAILNNALLYSIATVCAFSLFFLAFGGPALAKFSAIVSVVGGLSLVAVTFGSISFFMITLLGFVLLVLASVMANRK